MKKISIFSAIILFVGFSFSSYAKDGKEKKVVAKYQETVDNAAPDDWYTLAECADICLRKKINCKEISIWLDESLKIKETPFNLEVKGDYYVANNLPEKAGDYYLKALILGTDNDSKFDATGLQTKIARLVNLKIVN